MVQSRRNNLDQKKKTVAIFLDHSKALATLDQSQLTVNLRVYGFSVDSLKSILSYLKNRKQRTVIENSYSFWEKVLVPQLSILDPLLFKIFVNDLFLLTESYNIKNLADDKTL